MPTADEEDLRAQLDAVEARIARTPGSPVDLEMKGRLERELDRPGWRDALREAAQTLESWGRRTAGFRSRVAYLAAIAEAPGAADALDDLVAWLQPRVSAPKPDPQDVAAFVVAAHLLGRDQDVVSAATGVASRHLGPAIADLVALSAARADGDGRALEEVRDRWRQRAAEEPVASSALVPAARDVVRWVDGGSTGT